MSNVNKNIIARISLFYLIVFMLGMLIIGKIVLLQFFSPELKAEGELRAVREEVINARRGDILAYDGRVLATSLPFYELRMDFNAPGIKDSIFKRDVGRLAESLALLFKDKSATAYKTELQNAYANKTKNRYKKIGPRRVSFIELQEVKQFPIFKMGRFKGGFQTVEQSDRVNPYGSLAYRTIGRMVNKDSAIVGIEKHFDKQLRGKPGVRMMQRVAINEWMPISSEKEVHTEDGYDIITTLDVDVQDAAEVALKEQLQKNDIFEGGTAIVMEVKTGEVRAIANMKRNSNGTYDEAFNYAIAERSDPGSTFKLVTLLALLEDGYADLNTMVETGNGQWTYAGKTFKEASGAYGSIPLLKVFEKSSNVGFAKMAVQHYKGKEVQFYNHIQNFGMGKRLGLQIDGESEPLLNTPDKWSGMSLPQIAMGYEVQVAPIHTLTLYNAVANGGKMVKPKFVTELRKRGQTVETYPTEVINSSICSASTLKGVMTAMEGVVSEGTAKEIKEDIYTIAGKTGTAQILFDNVYFDAKGNKKTRKIYKDRDGRRKHQASFVGYFPANNPKYSAIVVLYTAKTTQNFYGGKWAAPVFKKIADKVYATSPQCHDVVTHNGVFVDMPLVKGGRGNEVNTVLAKLEIPSQKGVSSSSWVSVSEKNGRMEVSEKNIQKTVVPSVINMGLKDALYLLENMGLKVSASGKGSVKSQSIPPGSRVNKGESIFLSLEL